MKKHIQIWHRPKDSEIPNRLEWAKTLVNEILDTEIQLENEVLSKRSAVGSLETMEKMEIKTIKIDSRYSFPSGYDTRYYKYGAFTESDVSSICSKAIAHSTKLYESAKEQHEPNKPAIENNIKIRDGIIKMMRKFGVRETYSKFEYKTARSRTRTETTFTAGYLEDLRRDIIISDGFESIERSHNQFLEQVEKWRISELKKIEDERQKAEQAEEAAKKERELMKLIVKYDLPSTSTGSDVLEHIINKDKYLYLAHYMLKNRGDWNDGYSYAEEGLSNFTVETDLDRKIYNDVQNEIDHWDGDGRCFRDCEYSYDVIFGYADPELLNDYNKVCSL